MRYSTGSPPARNRTPWCCDGRKPLPHSRENSGWSVLLPLRLRDHHDERRQVLVLAAEAVAEPRAQARPAGLLVAGLDEGDRRVVVDRLGVASILTIAMSSTIFAVCGSSSLTHAPDLPVLRELEHRAARPGSDFCPDVMPVMPLAHADRVGQLLVVMLVRASACSRTGPICDGPPD